MGVESEGEENGRILPIIVQYIYDGEDLCHPYKKLNASAYICQLANYGASCCHCI